MAKRTVQYFQNWSARAKQYTAHAIQFTQNKDLMNII